VAWYLLGLALLLFGALLLYLEYVAAPLKRMSEASLRFANGDFSTPVDEAGPPHARQLARSLNQMAKALALRYEHVAQTVQHSQEVLIALEMLAREQSEEVAKQNIALKAQAHELREHREVLATQNQVLSAQNEALQRASRHKSEFLANMSHELRTPLNAVIGFSELMMEGLAGPLSPEGQEYTQDILRSGRHLLAMINDILDLAKIESGKMELRSERVDLALALWEAEEMARPMALRKGLKVELRAGAPVFCTGDAQRLRQVALNLLSNAVKFTPAGGGIVCEARPSPDGKSAELVVTDTGIGIAPEDHETIFEQFRQLDGSNAREYEGTGLGLALVRQFVEAMAGRVTVQSELGKGSTFTVRLPLSAAAEGRPLNVLVGTDAPAPRERLVRVFTEAGYAVQAVDANQGVQATPDVDVVVLDISRSPSSVPWVERLSGGPGVMVLVAESADEEISRLRALGAEVCRQTAPKSELIESLERLTSRLSARRAA
jgi:signal transduction histidine kinase